MQKHARPFFVFEPWPVCGLLARASAHSTTMTDSPKAQRVALIGYGAISRIVTSHLRAEDPHGAKVRVVGVLVREARIVETQQTLLAAQTKAAAQAAMLAASSATAQGIDAAIHAATACATSSAFASVCKVVGSVEALIALEPTLIVECAGQGAVVEYGPAVLASGINLMIISTGALADDDLRGRMMAEAEAGSARMLLPAGAIAGLDGLGALRIGGLDTVTYTSIKPPGAWRGTPAEEAVDLGSITEQTTIFSGPAADAARLYPKNANLAATVALAGLGLQKTQVTLIADPACTSNTGRIEASGRYGTLRVECSNLPAPDNPKTSANTGLSLAHALLKGSSLIDI